MYIFSERTYISELKCVNIIIIALLGLELRELESSDLECIGKRKRYQHFICYKVPTELLVRVAPEGFENLQK